MTISSANPKAGPYLGDGENTVFEFEFTVFSREEVQVLLTSPLGGETALVLDSDFFVSLNADQSETPGGYVSLSVAPETGYKVSILSDIQFDQEVDLTNAGGFYPDVIERALDKLTLQTLQLRERIGRALLASVASGIQTDDYLGQAIGASDAAVSAAQQAIAAANAAIVAAEQAQAIAGLDISNLALKTGLNATGTWGIGITGNAATATDASKLGGQPITAFVRKVNGGSPDANGNATVDVGVTSVGGVTGPAVSNAQVAAAAIAGLGYTPANAANAGTDHSHDYSGLFVAKGLAALAVGMIAYCENSNGSSVNANGTIAGSVISIGGSLVGSGTWKNIGPATVIQNSFGMFQRIS